MTSSRFLALKKWGPFKAIVYCAKSYSLATISWEKVSDSDTWDTCEHFMLITWTAFNPRTATGIPSYGNGNGNLFPELAFFLFLWDNNNKNERFFIIMIF